MNPRISFDGLKVKKLENRNADYSVVSLVLTRKIRKGKVTVKQIM